MWIGETDWTYRREFDLDSDLLSADVVALECDGLDTLATIHVNGTEVAKTDNQFRTYRFEIKNLLKSGMNEISVSFSSTIPYIQERQEDRYLNLTGVGHHRIDGSNRIRKSQCNYGWDWGPMCVTAGIWRDIALRGYSVARIDDVHIRQRHDGSGSVELDVSTTVERIADAQRELSLAVTARVDSLAGGSEGEVVAQVSQAVSEKAQDVSLRIDDPQLWWPNGLGDQPLYTVTVELRSKSETLDSSAKTVGLRTLTLTREEDKWGESFKFTVNGRDLFSKGANWIPADTFVTRLTDEHYEHLIRSAADANMNMLRVWGGGIYEQDVFYELCDRYGILVWQDFMFACSAYPAYEKDWLDNVRAEAQDNVRRIRHHPSLALWCGNNEIEQIRGFIGDATGEMTWDEYKLVFDDMLPAVVDNLDPDTPYWPSSPHSPHGDRSDVQNPKWGDAHLWSVWHGRQPFEWYRTCEHRFNSEFGFQSFPEPRVTEGYTEPKDRNITSYIMEWHQRSGIGNDAILQYMLSWFQLPDGFENLLWMSQILQGMAIKYAVEHWRRSMPRGMGTLYWQLNDCWPVASWSSIDYFGNWKALNYMARRFFAPVLVSALERVDKGLVEIHVTSDRLESSEGEVEYVLSDTEGHVIATDHFPVAMNAGANSLVRTVDVSEALETYGKRKLLFWLYLTEEGRLLSDNLAFFERPKHLVIQRPKVDLIDVKETSNGAIQATVRTDLPAFWIWLEIEGVPARFSDNFFHLPAKGARVVTIWPSSPTALRDVSNKVRVRTLTDTYANA
jgi:beta-mannosidase